MSCFVTKNCTRSVGVGRIFNSSEESLKMVMGSICDTIMTSKPASDEDMRSAVLVVLNTGSYQQQDCNCRVDVRRPWRRVS